MSQARENESNRREFLAAMARLGLGASAAPLVWMAINSSEAVQAVQSVQSVHSTGSRPPPAEAEYYAKNADGSVSCMLCPRHERLGLGDFGFCRVRQNVGGVMKTHASGQPCVLNVDAIEKNPLAHVLPGADVLSIAHAGCNMRCQYCQNWQFSQESPAATKNIEFKQEEAFDLSRSKRLAGVNFTYTEGTTHIEFNKRLAAEAKRRGFRAFLCSNGYIRREPMADFLPYLDAVTITIKSMRKPFQSQYLAVSDYEPVLETCRQVKQAGKWIEIATLLAPGLNDGGDEIRDVAAWIHQNLGPDTPWHLERFVPKYKMQDRPPTPAATLEKARSIGMAAGLRYVLIDNLAPHAGNHTYCPGCRKAVIKRVGFKVIKNDVKNGRCVWCRTPIPGIWT